jgi:hypothetical protein
MLQKRRKKENWLLGRPAGLFTSNAKKLLLARRKRNTINLLASKSGSKGLAF